ncbi:transposase [Streptomyces platensis]|uniref:transposase n=1 Tax=Streptomyces platensis TaxID=58346 RepID=UPI003D15FD6E
MPLTDAQWARTEPLLPNRTPKRVGRWRDHREVIDAIAFKFQTGTQWMHLPEKCGNWRGVYNRLRMSALEGTWERVLTDPDEWLRAIDVQDQQMGTYGMTSCHREMAARWHPSERPLWAPAKRSSPRPIGRRGVGGPGRDAPGRSPWLVPRSGTTSSCPGGGTQRRPAPPRRSPKYQPERVWRRRSCDRCRTTGDCQRLATCLVSVAQFRAAVIRAVRVSRWPRMLSAPKTGPPQNGAAVPTAIQRRR